MNLDNGKEELEKALRGTELLQELEVEVDYLGNSIGIPTCVSNVLDGLTATIQKALRDLGYPEFEWKSYPSQNRKSGVYEEGKQNYLFLKQWVENNGETFYCKRT